MSDFWKPSEELRKINSQQDFFDQLEISEHVSNVLYFPEDMKPDENYPYPKIKIKNKKFSNVSFSKTAFENVDLDCCEFIKCFFIGSSFVNCKLTHCKFVSTNTFNIKFDMTYVDPNDFRYATPNDDLSNIGKSLFQSLFNNLKSEHQPDLLRNAEYNFMIWSRKHEWTRVKRYPKSEKIKHLFKYFLLCLQFFIGYGVRFRFYLASLLSLFTFFCVFNYLKWNLFEVNPATSKDIENVLFFTYYSFASIGSTPISPTAMYGVVTAMIEGVFGWMFLGIGITMIIKRLVR